MCVISSRCRDELENPCIGRTKLSTAYPPVDPHTNFCVYVIVCDAKSDTCKPLIRCMSYSCCRMVTRSLRANVLTSSQQRADDSGMAWRSRGQRHLPVPAASSSGEHNVKLFREDHNSLYVSTNMHNESSMITSCPKSRHCSLEYHN